MAVLHRTLRSCAALGLLAGAAGCGDRAVVAPPGPVPVHERILDTQYAHRQFFRVSLADEDIDPATIQVYLDTGDPAVVLYKWGKAYLDPSDTAGAPAYVGRFVYQPPDFYRVNVGWLGVRRPVLELTGPLAQSVSLAVCYRRRDGSQVGYDVPEGPLVLKLIHPKAGLVATTGYHYVRTDPWYPATFYELHNIYRLAGMRIDPATFRLKIYSAGIDTSARPPLDYQADETGRPVATYIEITGLDNEVLNGSVYAPGLGGHGDGLVDGDVARGRSFVDYERGLLIFPDPRPFYYQPDTGLPPGFAASEPADVRRPARFTEATADTGFYTLGPCPCIVVCQGECRYYYLQLDYSAYQ